MNTQVAVREQTLPGLLPNEEALELANGFGATLEGFEVLIVRMPTATERQIMTSRNAALVEALTPIGESRDAQSEAATVVASLLVGYGSTRRDKAAAETVTVYLEHLRGVPLFAIRAACEDVKAGRVYDVERRTGNRIPLDPDFPPSTIRLRQVAQKHVDAMELERSRFDRVLRAKKTLPPPICEEERRAVGERFRELQADMARRVAEGDLEETARKARLADEARTRNERLIVAEYEALGLEPVRSGGVLCSLSMMKAAGWRVEETNFGGEVRRALVSPAGAARD